MVAQSPMRSRCASATPVVALTPCRGVARVLNPYSRHRACGADSGRLRMLARGPSGQGFARAQGAKCVKHHAVDLQPIAEEALARTKGPLGRYSDLRDMCLARRCLDGFYELSHALLKDLGRPKQVWAKRDE